MTTGLEGMAAEQSGFYGGWCRGTGPIIEQNGNLECSPHRWAESKRESRAFGMWRFEEADEPPLDTMSVKDDLDARVMLTENRRRDRTPSI
jgi:hypothetical protein